MTTIVVGVKPNRLVTYMFTLSLSASALASCDTDGAQPPAIADVGVHGLANGCFSLGVSGSSGVRYLTTAASGARFAFATRAETSASRFVLRPADLGTYLLRDAEGAYLTAEEGVFVRSATLLSDDLLNEDGYVSSAEWGVEASEREAGRFRLRNRATSEYLTMRGPSADEARAAEVFFTPAEGCAPFPELTIDAVGQVTRTHFEDGTLFGVVDAHSHLFTNQSFGGGGVFHGAPFHRLGVEHALPDCEHAHGFEGERDLIGFFYGGGLSDLNVGAVALISGRLNRFVHHTAGYPLFTDWPNAWASSTHQTQYYKWVERAYLSGLRLLVQHATSNQVLCELATGVKSQERRFSCSEMESVERSIDETYALERYIDAQAGGPGMGFFRVVSTPEQARSVIAEGRLAVVLGIETSNLFDCHLVPREGSPTCDEAYVRERLDHFRARGVRALFPVHKLDNAFSAGDGHRSFIEVGNLLSSGHYSNFTTDCDPGVPAVFDHGDVVFGGLNMPRDEYDEEPPLDISGFVRSPVGVLLPLVGALEAPPLVGDYCQNAGLTALGETLLEEMMLRGFIIEIDHFSRRSYARALELLVANDYPAAGTHGSDANGALYSLGGISTMGLPRCGNAGDPLAASASVRARIERVESFGGYPAQGFSFDFNGFAGAPRPRFGPDSRCSGEQSEPITYPFVSFAGDVSFEAPRLGERDVDFNTEGMIHIGLLPELIEDARRIGVTDDDLEPLFRSAEGYIRMWERAEMRAAALRAGE